MPFDSFFYLFVLEVSSISSYMHINITGYIITTQWEIWFLKKIKLLKKYFSFHIFHQGANSKNYVAPSYFIPDHENINPVYYHGIHRYAGPRWKIAVFLFEILKFSLFCHAKIHKRWWSAPKVTKWGQRSN